MILRILAPLVLLLVLSKAYKYRQEKKSALYEVQLHADVEVHWILSLPSVFYHFVSSLSLSLYVLSIYNTTRLIYAYISGNIVTHIFFITQPLLSTFIILSNLALIYSHFG